MISAIVTFLGCFIRTVLCCLGALFLFFLNCQFCEWFLTTCNAKDSPTSVTNDDRQKLQQQQQQQPLQQSESAVVWRLVVDLLSSNKDGVLDSEDHDNNMDAENKDDDPGGARRRSPLQNGHRPGRYLTHVMSCEYVEMKTDRERRHRPNQSRDETTHDSTLPPPENNDRASAKNSPFVHSLRQTFLPVDADVWNRSFRARSLSTMSSSAAAAAAEIVFSYIELAAYEARLHQSRDGVTWPLKPGEKLYWTLDVKNNLQSVLGRQTQLEAVYWITLEKVAPTASVNKATPEVKRLFPDHVIIHTKQFPQPPPPVSEKRGEQESPTVDDEDGPLTALTQDLGDDVIVTQIDDKENNLKPIESHSHSLETPPDHTEFIGH